MSLKDYLENDYTLGELLMLDDWFNGNKDYSKQCEIFIIKIFKESNTEDIKEVCVCIKTLIIERLKYALNSIRISADIL